MVLFTTLYNVPRFIDGKLFRMVVAENGTVRKLFDNETMDDDVTMDMYLQFGPTDLRKDPYYIRIYIQYMNIIFNQIGPFLLLGVLNYKGNEFTLHVCTLHNIMWLQ